MGGRRNGGSEGNTLQFELLGVSASLQDKRIISREKYEKKKEVEITGGGLNPCGKNSFF